MNKPTAENAQNYDTLLDALNDLKARGYTHDFNISQDCLECREVNLRLQPHEFHIREFYRFEGMTDPDDNSVVYAIESDQGMKGTLVNAYGVYADAATDALVRKLEMREN